MQFRKHIKEEFGLKQFDIAPLIDVVFILLIFFMLTSNFIAQPGIRIDLPKTVTSGEIMLKRVNLTVSAEDVLYLNGKVVTLKEIKAFLLKNESKIKSIFIKADKNSSFGRAVEIWDICKSLGFTYVNIATANAEK